MGLKDTGTIESPCTPIRNCTVHVLYVNTAEITHASDGRTNKDKLCNECWLSILENYGSI